MNLCWSRVLNSVPPPVRKDKCSEIGTWVQYWSLGVQSPAHSQAHSGDIGVYNTGAYIYVQYKAVPSEKYIPVVLTLSGPGEVKVDLANFDLKLQENLLSTFFTYSCKNVFRIFLKFWHDLKKWRFDVHLDIFSSEVGPWRPLPNPPPFHSVLLLLRITWGGEKSRRAVVHSTVRRQSKIPISFRSRAA
jgi:hypothetical protein